jgi:hypothetical protein
VFSWLVPAREIIAAAEAFPHSTNERSHDAEEPVPNGRAYGDHNEGFPATPRLGFGKHGRDKAGDGGVGGYHGL